MEPTPVQQKQSQQRIKKALKLLTKRVVEYLLTRMFEEIQPEKCVDGFHFTQLGN